MDTYKIAVIPGDGIGPEIVPAGTNVLDAVAEKFGFELQYQKFSFGAGYYKQAGKFMPDVDDNLPAKAIDNGCGCLTNR